MSKIAFKKYEEARKEQLNRNEARSIRASVAKAQQNPHPAGLRWPFELLQNALDSGPREDRSFITIGLRRESSKVVFEHDGAPFTSLELAALLSGGSSKEFESDVTTGRFGTGFLVTHVLAEQTELHGLLEVGAGYEQFELMLDRSGDEDAILENIHSCNDAIRAATPLSDLDRVPSARFKYPITDDSPLTLGLEALKRALPYLFATRTSLGRVELETEEGCSEVWTAGEIQGDVLDDGYVEYRLLKVDRNGSTLPEIRVYRFMTREGGKAAALVLLERLEDGWKVRLPQPDAPRVFREYPLRGSGFLPINFVLDGKFEPDQERSKLFMTDEDKRLLEDAFDAAVVAVKYAFDQKWEDAHLLARACKPATTFDQTDAEEGQWWTEKLASFAERLARLSIVDCMSQVLPAITSEGSFADFVIPRLLPNSSADETTIERMWPLVRASTDLLPPRKELALDWTEIAEGWHGLGLQLARVTVSRLAEYVRDEAETLDQLHVEGDPKQWLARFFDIVGECWSKRAGVDLSVLAGMVPDQNQRLCSHSELRRDGGVPDRLKDICRDMGYDIRSELLLGGFEEIAEAAGLTFLTETIEQAIPTSVSEADVIDTALKHLHERLPEDEDCDEATTELQKASVRLLVYLWESHGKNAASIARKMPLIASNQRAVRWSHSRMMMAPVCSWHELARPFAKAFPPDRVLADFYAGCEEEGSPIPDSVAALVEWGIAIADPITTDTPAELQERRLAAISLVDDTEGIVVRGETFSQIALLQPAVLNRCQEGIDKARALLGLVLCHIAPHDPAWQEKRVVKGRKSREDVDILVHGALWLADLKYRAWVPVPGEDGKPVKMVANAATLKDLLDPAWLEQNDAAIELLSKWFEFDELDLRLLGIAPDAEKRQELRNGLAKLVESVGADPGLYESLAEEVEAGRRRSRDVERCRRLGMAVQEAIKSAMESYDLKLELIDKGFDYEVTPPTDEVIEDATTILEIGPYLLEVKATTKGQARLTPTQAETASINPTHYVLCVVDLRNLSTDELDEAWTAARVEPLAKIVPDIGGKVEETCQLVEAARTSPIGIRNDSALRYEVPFSVWDQGVSISEWVSKISEFLREKSVK